MFYYDFQELLISKWESFLQARSVKLEDLSNSICCIHHVFGENKGKQFISDGWLSSKNQNEILLRIHGDPFNFFTKAHAKRSYRLKVTPFDVRHKEVYLFIPYK
ncbi:unnamed protein product [Dracunculus medinensis]|uniref:Uncharacterized protein n=1 Tax=Dracunculus medinensis TaxID=318479 RepID=A0A3P7SYY2_DRAME|nr:unnamed protein product [Dracunculus medinensis]